MNYTFISPHNKGGLTLPTSSGVITAGKVVINSGTYREGFYTGYNITSHQGQEVTIDDVTYYKYN